MQHLEANLCATTVKGDIVVVTTFMTSTLMTHMFYNIDG